MPRSQREISSELWMDAMSRALSSRRGRGAVLRDGRGIAPAPFPFDEGSYAPFAWRVANFRNKATDLDPNRINGLGVADMSRTSRSPCATANYSDSWV
jgi:hypothetical protein